MCVEFKIFFFVSIPKCDAQTALKRIRERQRWKEGERATGGERKRGQSTTTPPPHILFIFIPIYFWRFCERREILALQETNDEKRKNINKPGLQDILLVLSWNNVCDLRLHAVATASYVCIVIIIICAYQNIFFYTSLPLIIIRWRKIAYGKPRQTLPVPTHKVKAMQSRCSVRRETYIARSSAHTVWMAWWILHNACGQQKHFRRIC